MAKDISGYKYSYDRDAAITSTNKMILDRRTEMETNNLGSKEGGELVDNKGYNEEFYQSLYKGCSANQLNAKDKNGLTLLHIAASLNNKASAQCLIKAGVDVSIISNLGVMPIDLAKANNNREIEEMIRSKIVPSAQVSSFSAQGAVEQESSRDRSQI